MITVTGAGGKTGQAVIRALARRGARVRALVHRAEQAAAVMAMGAGEAVAGDMRDIGTLERALDGARSVYHICPNVHPEELGIGGTVIEAARRAGIRHLVYHSVLHPQVEAMPHHWQKLRVEEQLFASGLPYTILQPAAYMQNVLAHRERMLNEGVYPVPYAVETRLGMVDLEDVAEAAAAVLCEAGHEGAIYELAGGEALTQDEVAEIVAAHLGRPVRARAVPHDEWARQARASGLGDYQVDTLLKMFVYYERHGFWGNPRVLHMLLGRAPATFAGFLTRADAWRE
ncbi:MAG: NmrA family NAD(P)-binding protein [Anaerolineae bacterium]|nr:NmrA family NAD(P)-binding protein [Anaerolineae bacterium]